MCTKKNETIAIIIAWVSICHIKNPPKEIKGIKEKLSRTEEHALKCKPCLKILNAIRGFTIPDDLDEETIQEIVKGYSVIYNLGLGPLCLSPMLKPEDSSKINKAT
ncbi:MAG: hypothetical protein PHG05_01685 [Candidatus Nanoarchaeia archaeon]|nr:hypothetical protein [Candidatus Nanoarchaeia archaeon]